MSGEKVFLIPILSPLEKLIYKVTGININENQENILYKEYYFDNFIDAIKFANEVAEIAELQNHHPDLEISWGKCKVKIWTHSINGLTENDFILAAKINSLLA